MQKARGTLIRYDTNTCDHQLIYQGKRTVELRTSGTKIIIGKRHVYYCPICKAEMHTKEIIKVVNGRA